MRITTLITLLSLFAAPIYASVPAATEDFDDYLKQQEARFNDIIPNTEKEIVWANDHQQATEYAIVYLHGFSATRQEIEPVPRILANALNANIFYTRLSGHGRTGQSLALASSEDWLEDARQAWEIGSRLGKKVILLSVSTGGTLSTWISAQPFAKDLYAQIMISPNFDLADKSAHILTWPIGLTMAKWLVGAELGFEPETPEKALYWTTRYPLEAGKHLVELVDTVAAIDKTDISAPTLIIYSPNDSVIDTQAVRDNFERFGSNTKKLIPFFGSSDKGQHVLAGDIVSPDSNEAISAIISTFINDLIKQQTNAAYPR